MGSLSCTNTTASPDEPTHSNASTPGTSITLISSSNGSVASTPLQKYLHLPTTAKTKKTPVASSETRAITGARVLTSAECLAIIKEKEMKKKQEKEEKEKRKRQREEKKRQREEEKRKREEEKRQREERKRQREEQKLKKAEQRRQKAEDRIPREYEKARKALDQARKHGESIQGTQESVGRVGRMAAKRPRLEDDTISSDKCCVCYQAFEEEIELGAGTEWVQCACTRWLHEDCIVDCIIESSGKERLCQYCT